MIDLALGIVIGVWGSKWIKSTLHKMGVPKNLKLIKIVKFDDGLYGIRRGYFKCYEYKDLTGGYWWSKRSTWFTNCRGSLEDVNAYFSHAVDSGTPI